MAQGLAALTACDWGRRILAPGGPHCPAIDLFVNGERVVIKSHVSIWGKMFSEARSHRTVIYASEKEMPCPMKI
jgi:hypothetical protein